MFIILLKFVQSVAVSSHSLSTTPAYSPALLALKRFVRGALRQLGIGAVSLMVILSISAHSSASGLSSGGEFKAENLSSLASTLHLQTQRSLSPAGQHSSEPDTETSESFPGFRSRMLRHRLTSARLSVPESREQAIPLEDYAIAGLSAAE